MKRRTRKVNEKKLLFISRRMKTSFGFFFSSSTGVINSKTLTNFCGICWTDCTWNCCCCCQNCRLKTQTSGKKDVLRLLLAYSAASYRARYFLVTNSSGFYSVSFCSYFVCRYCTGPLFKLLGSIEKARPVFGSVVGYSRQVFTQTFN